MESMVLRCAVNAQYFQLDNGTQHRWLGLEDPIESLQLHIKVEALHVGDSICNLLKC